MQNTFLTGIIVAFLLFSFKEKREPVSVMPANHDTVVTGLDTTKWFLAKLHQDTGVIEVTKRKAFIRFNEEKGSAGGNGSCNSFGSTMKRDGNSISFTNIFSTKMYCEGVQQIENSFFGLLAKVTRYEVKQGSLQLFNAEKLLLEFEK